MYHCVSSNCNPLNGCAMYHLVNVCQEFQQHSFFYSLFTQKLMCICRFFLKVFRSSLKFNSRNILNLQQLEELLSTCFQLKQSVSFCQYAADLFHTRVLEICSAGELAWNRARSDRTGELINRGLGRRKDPIMHSGC